MYIFRVLGLPLLISAWGAPVAAQSSAERIPLPQSLPTLPQTSQATIRADQFRLPSSLDGSNMSHLIPPTEFRAQIPKPQQSGVTCYAIRSYRVTRDDPESDSTRLAGYSTCQPSARFQVKDAKDPRETAPASFYQP
jgi:hypothetical protein